MHKFLINESAFANEVQLEPNSNPNVVRFTAVLQEAGVKNRNGRIYPKSVLEEAINSPYVQERLNTNSFYCEAGHPLDQSLQRQMNICQSNIACLVKKVWWEGNLLKAICETADTAIGRDMAGLIKQGSKVAFSLRAQGNVEYDPALNAKVVQSPIQMIGYDWVVNPSHDKAFMESICESTYNALIRDEKNSKDLAISKAITLYENGSIVDIQEKKIKEEDYCRAYNRKVKTLNEYYIYDPKDKIESVSENKNSLNLINESEDTIKKVTVEDYVLKSVRNSIIKNL